MEATIAKTAQGRAKQRIVVAMSGGVDSSTAAALLVEQGHEVIGIAMKTHSLAPKSNRACCTPDDMRDARRVADMLGIPFYVLAYEDVFAKEVVAPFVAAYRQGLTPNPCIACNDRVKFRPLLERARLLGADKLATGHYARLRDCGPGDVRLLRAVDLNKDQSYFLYRLEQSQLAMLTFPLGDMDKPTVRGHARRLGLALADKQESQDICFVGPQGYAAVVEQAMRAGGEAPMAPVTNELVDMAGNVVGHHTGIHNFTVGQRRGFGEGLFFSHETPQYVAHIDVLRGRVTLGPKEALASQEVEVHQLSWTAAAPQVGQEVQVQQRHREAPKAATVVAIGPNHLRLRFVAATLRGAPGQAAVLSVGDEVLGGGTISRCPPPTPGATATAGETPTLGVVPGPMATATATGSGSGAGGP